MEEKDINEERVNSAEKMKTYKRKVSRKRKKRYVSKSILERIFG